jgi:group I intron endonuclease
MNFVYITTNLITGKQYVGSHNGDVSDSYLGSGKLLLKAICKYGAENFKRKIIEICDPSVNLLLEEKYIIEYNTLIPNGYNISPTGGHGLRGRMSEETKEKIRQKNLGRKATDKTKKLLSTLYKKRLKNNDHPFKGRHHSDESKEKISVNRKGKTSKENHHYYGKNRASETREKISETLKGRHLSKEVKQKLSDASKNVERLTCDHCNKEFTPWGFMHHQKAMERKGYIIKITKK